MNKAERLKQHNEWLRKMGVSTAKAKRPKTGIYSIPNYSADSKPMPPTSDTVGNGYAKKSNAYSGSGSLVVGQAYNKGNYVVLSKSEAADPTTGKRR